MFCTICGNQMADDAQFCNKCGKTFGNFQPGAPVPPPQAAPSKASQGMNFDFSTNTASAGTAKRYEYKVLSQKDKWFSSKFDPMMLEQALNAYAQQGWRVVGCATADIAGFGTGRQEFISLLEREIL